MNDKIKINDKITLEGELFVLVEEDEEKDGVDICIEIGGINLWDWIWSHKEENVKITMEVSQLNNEATK